MARIMVLQDEDSWNAALRRCLSAHHSLVVIESSDAAIELLRQRNFDLVISRVHFKTQDVFHFLRTIKGDPFLAKIPVVCFCGLRSELAKVAHDSVELACRTLGADDYLSIEEFCDGEECNLEAMREAIESIIH